ncbi:hypothetical protein SGRI78S_02139 [Streptomyces griseus subsp. griseus]
MRTRRTAVAAVSVAAAAALSAPALASADGRDGHDMNHRGHKALTAVGLTADQRLVEFTVDRPARTTASSRALSTSEKSPRFRFAARSTLPAQATGVGCFSNRERPHEYSRWVFV